jgi:hypothetical protein
MVSRVELFALIRRDARVEGLSVRALADRHGVHRRTVRQALASAVPPPRKTPTRSSPVTGPLRGAMDEILRVDVDAPPKQRHTEREERSSIAIASNSAFSEWARTFTDPRLCAAIVDRLTFDASIIETGTESFRLRTTKRRRNTRRAS